MRGQLLFTPEKSQFVKDIINQVWEYKYGKLPTILLIYDEWSNKYEWILQANTTYRDLEPSISLLKIYASIGFRAEELSKMEGEFEVLNASHLVLV